MKTESDRGTAKWVTKNEGRKGKKGEKGRRKSRESGNIRQRRDSRKSRGTGGQEISKSPACHLNGRIVSHAHAQDQRLEPLLAQRVAL